jgi:cold shock CspA family protein
MLWFNEAKDFGFISTEAGERLYVHGTGFAEGERPKGRCAGTAVSFHVAGDGGERRAEHTVLEAESSPRRARRHHGAGRARV